MIFKPKRRDPRFTTRLREFREQAGLTTQDLAEHCQVAPETIELIEDAKYEPTVVLAERIAKKLDTTVEALFTITSPSDIKQAPRDERLEWASYRYGFWLMVFLVFGCLFASNVILAFHWSEDAGIAVFAVWAVGGGLFVISSMAIPGYWRFTRSANRANTSPKWRILSSIIGGLFYATSMFLLIDTDKNTSSRAHEFLKNLCGFSILLYAINYFQWRFKRKK